jgi:hypothetical protein
VIPQVIGRAHEILDVRGEVGVAEIAAGVPGVAFTLAGVGIGCAETAKHAAVAA